MLPASEQSWLRISSRIESWVFTLTPGTPCIARSFSVLRLELFFLHRASLTCIVVPGSVRLEATVTDKLYGRNVLLLYTSMLPKKNERRESPESSMRLFYKRSVTDIDAETATLMHVSYSNTVLNLDYLTHFSPNVKKYDDNLHCVFLFRSSQVWISTQRRLSWLFP